MALYIDSTFLSDILLVAHPLMESTVTTNPGIVLAVQERGQKLIC